MKRKTHEHGTTAGCRGGGRKVRRLLGAALPALTLCARAQVVWVGDTAVNDAWEHDANWSAARAPTNTDAVVIAGGCSEERPVTISSSGQEVNKLTLGGEAGTLGALRMAGGSLYSAGEVQAGGSGTGLLRIDAGSLTGKGAIRLGTTGAGTGTLRVAGGTIGTANDIGIGHGGRGLAVVTDGTLYTEGNFNNFHVGSEEGSEGTLIVSNGTVYSSYAIYVGEKGRGALLQTGGTVSMDRQLYVGDNTSGTGEVHLAGGTLKVSYDCYFGRAGHARVVVDDGVTVSPARAFQAGTETGGVGIVEAGEATFDSDSAHYAFIVGGAGKAAVRMKGTTFLMNRNGLKVRTGESGFGLVRGWGVWKSGAAANYKVNANVNNGLVVADGCGEERDMDFSSYVASADTSSVANAIENASTNGWYAVNKGRLVLGGIDLSAGEGVGASWGESFGDEEIDLVNSVRFEFFSVTKAGRLVGKLLAADRSDVPALPGGGACVGVWDFSFSGAFDTADVQFRHDHSATAGKGLLLKRWDAAAEKWESVATTELPGHRVEAQGLTSLGLFALLTVPRPTLLLVR
jgi:hypothetical protein